MKTALILAAVLLGACGSSESGPATSTAPEPTQAVDPEPGPVEPAPADPVADRGAPPASAESMDVADWQAILTDFATEDGGFRYAALREDAERRAQLDGVAEAVGAADVAGWGRDAKLAFYINAYNALTVKAVIDAWPIESVMRVEGFFDATEHRVAGAEMTLNHLENEVIRGAEFAEPRIHFAVNCASAGCPRLSRTAFEPDNLEAQLAERAQEYVRRTTRFQGQEAMLSQIFEWFEADFAASGGVREFVASRLEDEAAARLRSDATGIGHFEYDWAVNSRE